MADRYMFFQNMRDTIKKFPREQQLELREAIDAFVFDGVESDNPYIRAIIQSLKPSLEYKSVGAPAGNKNNKTGKNQHSKDNGGQSAGLTSTEDNLGQSGQPRSIGQETEAEAETETEAETEANDSCSPPPFRERNPEPESFEPFWQAYPRQRRGSRAKALQAYLRALSRASPEEIQSGLDAYRASDEVARGYAKGAEAWLNDDRWTVDYSGGPAGRHGEDDFERILNRL